MIALIALLTAVLIAGRATIQQWRAVRFLSGARDASTPPAEPPIVVVLPAHREADIVDRTLDHFIRLADAVPQLEIVVATSARPTDDDGTNARVLAWAARHPLAPLVHLQDQATPGSKSSKLNLALSWIAGRYGCGTIVGVYDFDSRPEDDTFAAVRRALKADRATKLIQQIPFPLGEGLERLSWPSKLYAIGHTERVLRIECEHARTWRQQPTFARDLRIAMGAGLFIELETIRDLGGFPDDSDDIRLGYRLDLMGVERAIVAPLNLVQPNPTLRASLMQSFRIYDGVLSCFDEVRSARRGVRRLTGHMRACLTLARDMETSGRPLALLALAAMAWGSAPFGALAAVCILALGYAPFLVTLQFVHAVRKRSASTPVELPVPAMLLGPFLWGTLRASFFLAYLGASLVPGFKRQARSSKTDRL